MRITLEKIKVKDLVDGYVDSKEEGVVAYGGKLNVRPKYQREFIYSPKEELAVIDTLMKGFPLNSMYWVKNADGTYEVLDGQQRTLSICHFFNNDIAFNMEGCPKAIKYANLARIRPALTEAMLNYELLVYICEGTKDEQLDWFRTINIAGKALTDQELRNINFTGEWLTAAKKYFSKTNCSAAQTAMSKNTPYISGTCIRQDILELVLKWITNATDGKKDEYKICQYMAEHQFDANADELCQYFENVINWVKELFPNYRKEMKGIDWGFLYNQYHDYDFDPDELEEQINALYADEDVTKQKGVYYYLFDGDATHLSIRKFPDAIRNRIYAQQKGICPICGKHFIIKDMQADHIVPWSKGGKTIESNCQMLCKQCNKDKSCSYDEEE